MNIFSRRTSDSNKNREIDRHDCDRQLVADCLAGNRKSRNELFQNHYLRIFYYFLKSYGADNDVAGDLTQETFVKAFNGLKKWKGEARFSTWLYQIAINTGKDHLRRRRNQREEQKDSIDDNPVLDNAVSLRCPSSTPEEIYARKETHAKIEGMTHLLPEEEKQVILLYYCNDEFTYEEIQQVTGFSVGKIKKLHYSALARLAKRMKGK